MSSNYPGASEAGSAPFSLDTPDVMPSTAESEVSSSEHDDDSDESKSFGQRALEWEEDEPDVLDWIMDDLKAAFERGELAADQRRIEMRTACEELLSRERTPAVYRAQLCVYLAYSEDEDEVDPELIYDRVDEAQFWVDKADAIMLANHFYDPRVAALKGAIRAMRRRMEECEAENKKNMEEWEAENRKNEGQTEGKGKGQLEPGLQPVGPAVSPTQQQNERQPPKSVAFSQEPTVVHEIPQRPISTLEQRSKGSAGSLPSSTIRQPSNMTLRNKPDTGSAPSPLTRPLSRVQQRKNFGTGTALPSSTLVRSNSGLVQRPKNRINIPGPAEPSTSGVLRRSKSSTSLQPRPRPWSSNNANPRPEVSPSPSGLPDLVGILKKPHGQAVAPTQDRMPISTSSVRTPIASQDQAPSPTPRTRKPIQMQDRSPSPALSIRRNIKRGDRSPSPALSIRKPIKRGNRSPSPTPSMRKPVKPWKEKLRKFSGPRFAAATAASTARADRSDGIKDGGKPTFMQRVKSSSFYPRSVSGKLSRDN